MRKESIDYMKQHVQDDENRTRKVYQHNNVNLTSIGRSWHLKNAKKPVSLYKALLTTLLLQGVR